MNSFLENRPVAVRTDGKYTPPPKTEAGFHAFIPQDAPAAAKPAPAPMAPPPAEMDNPPRVELVQNDGKVERIIVTCSCCNRIELQCKY